MKNIIKKFVENIKVNPFKTQLLVVRIYPILPLALLASWMILLLLSKFTMDNNAITSLQDVSLIILGFVWFIGGPLGLLGGFLILFNKHSWKSTFFFVYGSISYLIIVGFFIIQSSILFIVGANYWMGLHTLYLLFTFWVIGKQLFTLYNNRKNEVLA